MLRASSLASISKSNPFAQESGMRHVATDTNWAVRDFADAELGDERRTTRLVELANVLGQHPTAALPEACGDGGCSKPRIASLITTPSTRRTCCKVISSRPT